MQRMHVPSVITAGLLAACSAPHAVTPSHRADELTFRDVMPEYWQWWTGAQALAADEQASSFWRSMVHAHPDLFSAEVLGKSFADEVTAHAKLTRYFTAMPARVDDMRAVSGALPGRLRASYTKFVAAFPDMPWTGPAYIIPSIGGFDGGTRLLAGQVALFFGPDGIVDHHRIDGKIVGLCSFIAHELFHIYHHHFFVDLPDQPLPLWHQLWEEGLATYIGGQQCPTDSESEVMMSTTLAGEARPRLAELARELRDKLDATDDDSLNRFFTIGTPSDVPTRAGYFVGFLVAQHAARAHTPVQLAKLDPATVRREIEAALDALAAVKP